MVERSPSRLQAVCLLAVAAFLPASCNLDAAPVIPGATGEQGVRAVRVATVEAREIDLSIDASGTLMPHETMTISSDVPGAKVLGVMVDAGSVVRKGDVLVQLDPTMLQSQIEQQQAVVNQHKVLLRQAEQENARTASLKGGQVLSDEAISARRFKVESTRATLQVHQAQLQELLLRRSRMTLRAPAAGIVIERNVSPGDLTGSSPRPLLALVPHGQMELRVQVPEARVPDLARGTPTLVTLADNRQFNGQVRRVGAQINQQSALADIWIGLNGNGSGGVLLAGMSGNAQFKLRTRAVPAVPEKALLYDTAGASVMLVDGDNRARRRPVKLGARGQGIVEVVDGVAIGDRILVGSAAFVADGEKVSPVRSTRAGA